MIRARHPPRSTTGHRLNIPSPPSPPPVPPRCRTRSAPYQSAAPRADGCSEFDSPSRYCAIRAGPTPSFARSPPRIPALEARFERARRLVSEPTSIVASFRPLFVGDSSAAGTNSRGARARTRARPRRHRANSHRHRAFLARATVAERHAHRIERSRGMLLTFFPQLYSSLRGCER